MGMCVRVHVRACARIAKQRGGGGGEGVVLSQDHTQGMSC